MNVRQWATLSYTNLSIHKGCLQYLQGNMGKMEWYYFSENVVTGQGITFLIQRRVDFS